MKIEKFIIIILSLILIILGFKYYKLLEMNENLMESKNFEIEWSPSQEILFSFWKKNNKLSDQHIDRNFDSNFEIVNSYDIYGNILNTSYDSNENGVYEKCSTFNSYGKIIGNSYDKNEDGAIDEFSIILENKNELKFIDLNNNGQYEKLIFVNKENNNKTEKLINELFE